MKSSRLLSLTTEFLKPYWKQVLLVLSLLPITSFCYSMQPLLIQRVIDGPLKNLDLSDLNKYIVFLSALIIVNFIFQVWQFRLMNFLGQALVTNIRSELFKHLEHLPMKFFDKTPVGRSVSRLTSDIEQIAESFAGGLILLVLDVFNIVGILAFMFYLNTRLSIAMVVFLLPIYWITLYYERMYRKSNLEARRELGNLNSILQQSISGISIVRILNSASRNIDKFAQSNLKYFRANDMVIKADAQLTAIVEMISLIALAGMVYISSLYINYGLSIGVVLAFLQYSQTLFDPIRNLSERFSIIQSAVTGLERMQELFDEPLAPNQIINSQPLPKLKPSDYILSFKHIYFRYDEHSNWVLKDFNLDVKPGQRIGIIGRTGAGKSTIVKLLLRLYEPNSGLIEVDGRNILSIDTSELRRMIALVPQDIYVFAGNLAENISLRQDIDWSCVQSILDQTSLNLDSNLSERGSNISAGEQQLINLARALVLDPKILILDEATSKIDSITESKIQKLLDQFVIKPGRTLIVVAHKPESLSKSDLIVEIQ